MIKNAWASALGAASVTRNNNYNSNYSYNYNKCCEAGATGRAAKTQLISLLAHFELRSR